MTLTLESEVDPVPFSFAYEPLAKQIIEKVIDVEQFPFEAEVNLLLVDNEIIHGINKEHRNIDRPTDVLSFPLLAYDAPADFSKVEDCDDNFNPDTGEAMLGDIVISVEKVCEQAEEFGHSAMREYAFLIVHSMLHLFGYDHMEPGEAQIMEAKQREILDMLGISR